MKSFRVSLRNSARQDIRKASRYYGKISKGLGEEFVESVNQALESLEIFSNYEVKLYELRIYNLKRFPYCVYYLVSQVAGLIDVVAVIHGHAQFPAERLRG